MGGKPSYIIMAPDRKQAFLYWNKSHWRIGWEFGSGKSVANVKDVGNLCCPCEPYPLVWRVIEKRKDDDKEQTDKKKSQYSKNVAMRIIDAATVDLAKGGDGLTRYVHKRKH